jgi:NADH-quinone oxidoreductase subunit E
MSTVASIEYPLEGVEDIAESVRSHVEEWRGREGNLIMILHAIQDEHGYIPRGGAMVLARELGVSLARIYEVITFYHYFRLVPPGHHDISVCIGTACYLKGSANVLEEVKGRLGIEEGQTTEDREYHLETVRCIGCCGMSPAMVIDGKTHGRVRTSDVADLLKFNGGKPT